MNKNQFFLTLENESYQPYEFYQMPQQFQKNVDPQSNLIAIASYGGQIAVCRNKNMISAYNSAGNDKVCFYNNNGDLKQTVDFPEYFKQNECDIIDFEFIEDELLFVLTTKGNYYLFNPFKGFYRNYSVTVPRNEQIIQGKIIQNGMVFLTEQNNFYYINSVFEPYIRELPKFDFAQTPRTWIPVAAEFSNSGRLEVHVAQQDQGVLIFVEDEEVKLFFSEQSPQELKKTVNQEDMPVISNIQMICQTYDSSMYAYLTKNNKSWTCWVINQDFQSLQLSLAMNTPLDKDGVQHVLDKENMQKPLQMMWCSKDCVILVFKNVQMLIGPSTFVFHKKQNTFFHPEVDGVRMLAKKSNSIFRKVPKEYLEVDMMFSTHPAYKLKESYLAYRNQQALEDEDIRNKKSDLAEGVKSCLEVGAFELDLERQSTMLKAASYGKTFLNSSQIDHDILFQKCKYLRVVHNLQKHQRCITYQQAVSLPEETFIKILLRYNFHHIAFEVCNYLNFEKKDLLIPQIYEHWACQKVELEQDDNTLCHSIKQKLGELKGVSYTEIAHKAIEKNKSQLALKLLDLEPEKSKRVPVLLSMAESESDFQKLEFYEKALEEALLSRESNFINMVLLEMIKSDCDEQAIYQIITQFPIANQHFLLYLQHFNKNNLQSYLESTGQHYRTAFFLLRQSGSCEDPKQIEKYLERAHDLFKGDKHCAELLDITQQWLSNIQAYIKKSNEKNGQLSKGPGEINVNNQLSFIMKDIDIDKKEVQHEAKHSKTSERTLYILKVKELIKANKTVELSTLLASINKKKELVPYELVAEIYMQQDDRKMAIQFLEKMLDVKEQVKVFMRIKEQDRAIKSIVNCSKSKGDKKRYLENLMEDYGNPELEQQCLQEIQNLKNK